MEHTTKIQTTQNNGLFAPWAIITVLLAAPLSILSAHGMYFYPLLLLVGFATGMGQWWLLRRDMERIWPWVLVSTFGWIGGLLLTVGILYGLGYIALALELEVGLYLVSTLQIMIYPIVFGITGTVQSIVLHRRGYTNHRWILWSVLAGLALSLLQVGTCAAGGGVLFTQAIASEGSTGALCVNIGLTIPRLQTAEPFFNFAPLSFTAHVMAWLAYALVSGYGINRMLTEPPQA